jgi:hypothetical protein
MRPESHEQGIESARAGRLTLGDAREPVAVLWRAEFAEQVRAGSNGTQYGVALPTQL